MSSNCSKRARAVAKVASNVALSGNGCVTASCSSVSGSMARPRSARESGSSFSSRTSTETRSG
jgi:hypothetical protein